ncbi:DUF1349 domain-containing protein [Salinactinospora qingdaonensis]|uniref:DUF1349 domain-containing protein n=1 Tax=Salinactinospora qingdaonensis TaxID=702744 RepID=A0ABP7FRV8_9ACTN
MSEPVEIPAFPSPLRWLNQPESWAILGEDTLVISAGGGTDLFTDPDGSAQHAQAPALVGRLSGDFTLSARVRLDLESAFDAAVLLLYTDDTTWAKLCLESSPQGRPTIVSVVTRGVSDDCNSFAVAGPDVELRISRLGSVYAFHARTDADSWDLIRYFALDGDPEVGFLAQSPLGEGRTVRFEDIRYSPHRLTDVRSGE